MTVAPPGRIDRLRAIRAAGLLAGLAGAAAIAFVMSPWPAAGAGTLFAWTLIYLAACDLAELSIPVAPVVALIVAGLIWHWVDAGADALIGGGAAALCAWLALEALRRFYYAARGLQGMGEGDPLIAAALGAWVGPVGTPLAVALGAGGTLAVALLRGVGLRTPVPLAPGLAIGGYAVWLMLAGAGA